MSVNNPNEQVLLPAARDGDTEIALALISSGVDVNAKAGFGFTPLYIAEREGHLETASAIRDSGGIL